MNYGINGLWHDKLWCLENQFQCPRLWRTIENKPQSGATRYVWPHNSSLALVRWTQWRASGIFAFIDLSTFLEDPAMWGLPGVSRLPPRARRPANLLTGEESHEEPTACAKTFLQRFYAVVWRSESGVLIAILWKLCHVAGGVFITSEFIHVCIRRQ